MKKINTINSFIMTIIASFFMYSFSINEKLYKATYDQAIFEYYGKAMRFGLKPYQEIFDNKGPILFIIEYLGSFFDNKVLFFLEVINIFVIFYILNKILMLYIEKKAILYGYIFLIPNLLIILGTTMGNNVEEFCLPWGALATYLFIKMILNKSSNYVLDNYLIGISLAVVCLIKLSNIMPMLIFLGTTIIINIKERNYRKLGEAVLYEILGIFTVMIPICIYLFITGILFDSFYQSVIFNIEYTKDSQNIGSLINAAKIMFKQVSVLYASSLCIILAIFILIKNAIKDKKLDWAILGVVCLWIANFWTVVMSGRSYPHYLIMQVPMSAALLGVVLKNKFNNDVIKFIIIIVTLLGMIPAIRFAWLTREQYKVNLEPEISMVKYINTHKKKGDTLFVYDSPRYTSIYLRTNMYSSFKYFTLPAIDFNKQPKFNEKFYQEWEKNSPTYVVISQSTWINPVYTYTRVKLKKDYNLVFQSDDKQTEIYHIK